MTGDNERPERIANELIRMAANRNVDTYQWTGPDLAMRYLEDLLKVHLQVDQRSSQRKRNDTN
jgi:hypothetical protein